MRLWSAETPYLYTLVLCLVEGRRGEREVEWESCRLGAKEVRIHDKQLLLNGRPILLKGVNRHEHDPSTGKVRVRVRVRVVVRVRVRVTLTRTMVE